MFGSATPVWVAKGGEVIPKVVGVVTSEAPAEARDPSCRAATCPVCGTPVVREVEEVALRCPNPSVPGGDGVAAARTSCLEERWRSRVSAAGSSNWSRLVW